MFLIREEIKKMLIKKTMILTLCLIFIGIIVSTISVYFKYGYYMDETTYAYGPQAVMQLQQESTHGKLTEFFLNQGIISTKNIYGNPKNYNEQGELRSSIIIKNQKDMGLATFLFKNVPSVIFQEHVSLDTLMQERNKNIVKSLERQNFKEQQIAAFETKNKISVNNPKFEMSVGWDNILQGMKWIVLVLMLITTVNAVRTYSHERFVKMDAVLLSTQNGRKSIIAKAIAVFLFTSIVYVTGFVLYSCSQWILWGMNGANTALAFHTVYFDSIYTLTFLQAYFLSFLLGWIGCCFSAGCALCLSACFKRDESGVCCSLSFVLFPILSVFQSISPWIYCILPGKYSSVFDYLLNNQMIEWRNSLYPIIYVMLVCGFFLMIIFYLLAIFIERRNRFARS